MSDAGTGQQLKALANMLLMQQRLREAQNVAELGFVLVNDTRTLVSYRSCALWLASSGDGKKGDILSVSGAVDHDPQSPFLQWMKQLSPFAAARSGGDLLALTREDVPEALAADWDIHGTEYLLWCPLRSGAGIVLGGMLLWREQATSEAEQRVLSNWLAAAGYSLSALGGKAFSRSPFKWTTRKKQVLVGALLAVMLALFLPVRLSVLAQGEIIAKDPVIVRSPMDGIIDTLHVRPNMLVQVGAALVDLDDSELQTRLDVSEQTLAINQAQYQQAAQAANFNTDAKASLRVLALESDKRKAELEYVQSLLERSQVLAQRDGVVIMPSPDELIGKPVVTGERLLTIADPANTQLEAWLAVGDDISLPQDAVIEFFPNVAPDKKFAARLQRMDYRAEVTDSGELAYRIRAEFDDPDSVPRIGMRGTAKLYGQKVSLAYYLMRRPLASLRRTLGV